MCFWNPTSPRYLHCFTPSVFDPPSQNSPTPLYSQHSSLSGSAEMEGLSCQLLTKNCPLALHLIQHRSLSPFCLIGADPVLILHCSPHSSHAGLMMPTHPASPHLTAQQPALLFAGRLIPREPPDPVSPLLPSLYSLYYRAHPDTHPIAPSLLYNFSFLHIISHYMAFLTIIYLSIVSPLTEV